ncbi:hypothetical protein [Aminobacter sp. LjRoot7]|uniref:hypothetical protein n=1 Tax=Aminobacter sp. LjRoot7 TaxID=3342335 RepID=UPI003ECEA1BB
MTADYIDWPSHSGTFRYWFLENPSDAVSIKKEPGNYMFAKLTPNGWLPVYIGIADDLSTRIPCHDRWDDAVKAGAIRVLGHTQSNPDLRRAEEIAMIAYWQPILNTQHRQAGSLLGGLGS